MLWILTLMLGAFLAGSTGVLHVELVDPYVEQIKGEVQVLDGNSQVATAQSDSHVSLPYGDYVCLVSIPGFEPTKKRIVIEQPSQWVRIGMLLGDIEDRVPNPITGRLQREKRGRNMWARLVAHYADVIYEARCERSGRFRFADVRVGRYVIQVFAGAELIHSEIVEINSETNNLKLGP